MPWLLGCHSPREPELLQSFFCVLGKALYVANAFEFHCRELLQFARFASSCCATGDFDAAVQLVATMKEKMLAGTLAELETAVPITPKDIELLERAKDARNFVAHEGGHIGHFWNTTAQHINAQFDLVRVEVRALADGDNVVSRWQYGIQEKEPAPIGMCEFYPSALEDWVFGGSAILDAGRMYYERHVAQSNG
jgi:hypothetical protein